MAANWVDKMAAQMAVCWAERMVVMRVGSRVGYMDVKVAGKVTG